MAKIATTKDPADWTRTDQGWTDLGAGPMWVTCVEGAAWCTTTAGAAPASDNRLVALRCRASGVAVAPVYDIIPFLFSATDHVWVRSAVAKTSAVTINKAK